MRVNLTLPSSLSQHVVGGFQREKNAYVLSIIMFPFFIYEALGTRGKKRGRKRREGE